MKVFLATVGLPEAWSAKQGFEALAATDVVRAHELTSDPDEADIILFTECHQLPGDWALRTLVRSPMARQYPHKTFVYDERDRPWCRLPGLYVSMPRSAFQPRWQRPWAYPAARLGPWNEADGLRDPDLLFSLVASPTHPSRVPLFALVHPRGLVEPVHGFLFHDEASADFVPRQQHFREVMARSKFVLCPRGAGTASIRLFETMRAGRVPVVISDEWVPPSGPDWSTFIVRWPEGNPGGLVDELERREDEAGPMGARARQAYLEWFAPETAFDKLVSLLAELLPDRDSFPRYGVIDRRWAEIAAHASRRRVTRPLGVLRRLPIRSIPSKS